MQSSKSCLSRNANGLLRSHCHLLVTGVNAAHVAQFACPIPAGTQAGVSEGVADLLTSSLEEERQAAFHFLFSFFDEVSLA